MINAIRSIRTQSPSLPITPSLRTSSYLGRKASRVGFRLASTTSQSTEPESDHDMDESAVHNPHMKAGDLMSHSFGEGYATRSEDEGFGGIYAGNQAVAKADQEQLIHENHPAYDKTQGCEANGKETARNQMKPKQN